MTDRAAAVQELCDIYNACNPNRIDDDWALPRLPSYYDNISDDGVIRILERIKNARMEKVDIPPYQHMNDDDDDEPEGSITVILEKSDVIRMLKGSPAPLGMEWDEQAMQSCSIDELMGFYASINWGQPQPVEEAPRIYIPGR